MGGRANPAHTGGKLPGHFRSSLGAYPTHVTKLYGTALDADAELKGTNARVSAAAEELTQSSFSSDEKLRGLLDERSRIYDQYTTVWHALLEAGTTLKNPIDNFVSGCERHLLSTSGRSALQLFLDSCKYSTQHEKILQSKLPRQKSKECIADFCQTHVQRVISSLELLARENDVRLYPKSRQELAYGMGTAELYRQTQEELVTFYPSKPGMRPAPDPALNQEWEDAQDDLVDCVSRYNAYFENDHEEEALVAQVNAGRAKSRNDFASQWLHKWLEDYNALQQSTQTYTEVRARAMAAGHDLVEEAAYLGIDPVSHHFEDGTVEDATDSCRDEELNGIDIEGIDAWRFEIPAEALSDDSTAQRSDQEYKQCMDLP
ncbi:hypothetical protein LTR36_008939 [Oleoguttula mirabilis]|uniref:Uncharacterized protein n=1 Tax=Oleoguttula mirabilis TaxID=1507867 RepID=A0AAV9J6T3_9PEZI|nr:hypothetical protein LTR36_008939 [Oleoguttula mirabilis]